MSTCMICGWPGEVQYVPGVKVKGNFASGETEETTYVIPLAEFSPRNDDFVKQEVIAEVSCRRVFCQCNDGKGRRP